ncbi:MAG: hypothetical protein EZS28_009232 [Streblomastix strix]|uniref:Uncharacterized protein n=1 Tax=Streblomastix strix TaxID=222440 RepID=A0A5J4WK63_9EUKA|nr:MAG: hypothetical protein EZS28_009232 [Streblomastix strix]
MTKINYRTNQKESQLMEKMTMETKTNLSIQPNPCISFMKTMDSERITAGRSYMPLSTEKRIPRSISQKYPPTFHLTMQMDQIDSEEMVAGRSCQPPLITTPPELGQAKGKVVVPKQSIQPTNDHDIKSKTGLPKLALDKSLGIPEARANFDTPNLFTPLQEQRKRADVALITEDKSVKRSQGNKISVGSKKQKQGSNSENLIEIEPDSETNEPDQLD